MRDLKRVLKKDRSNILKDQRVFISSESRVCPTHIGMIAWSGIDCSSPGLIHTYTEKQVEEMVDMLRLCENSQQLKQAGSF